MPYKVGLSGSKDAAFERFESSAEAIERCWELAMEKAFEEGFHEEDLEEWRGELTVGVCLHHSMGESSDGWPVVIDTEVYE